MAVAPPAGSGQTPRLRIGTRGSKLALAQAQEARSRLAAAHGWPETEIEIVPISTSGDLIRDRPLAEIGGKGLFTKEIEEALLGRIIDLAVHSVKDMPALLPEGLEIGALLAREDPRDALVSHLASDISGLPKGAVIGSSSVRRAAQLRRLRSDLSVVNFRGNVDTRLRKLESGDVHGTILACAGLRRLGLELAFATPIDIENMLPAVAQGAIGIEIRADDDTTRAMIAGINHLETEIAVACERAFLAALDGSCRTPLAGHAVLEGATLRFRGHALTPDGVHCFETRRSGAASDAARLGRDAGEEVKARGGTLIAF